MATKHTPSPAEAAPTEPTVSHDDVDVEATPPPLQAGTDAKPLDARDRQDGEKAGGTVSRDRERGKAVLPFSRVQKIIKADKDLPMVARDATFLISLATEEFIKRLSQACQRLAERDKRSTVQQKDVASVVHRVDEFLFLGEIIGSQEPMGRRKPQKSKASGGMPGDQDQLQPTLRNFVQAAKENEETGETANVVVSEDGAMYTQ